MRYRYPLLVVVSLVLLLAAMACAPQAQPTAVPTKPAAAPAAPTTAAPAATKPAAPAAATPAASTAAPKAEVKPLSPVVNVKVGSIGTLGGIAIFVAQEKGYFKEEGLDVEFVNFKTGGDMIPALSRGDIDAGSGAINAGLFNAVARDISLRLVAEPSTVDQSEGLMVRADLANQIKDWADLKGRKIGVSSTASSQEIAVDTALKKGGLTLKDVELQTMGFPDMLTAFANKAIDAADMTEPTTTQAVDQGLAVRWKLGQDINPGKQVGVIMYSDKFAKEKNEAAKRFMVGLVRGARDYYEFLQSGKGKDAIYAAATKYTTIKDTKLYDKMKWAGVNPDMTMKTDSVRADLDWYAKMGYVKQVPNIDQVIDNSFNDYALQRLGKYKK